MHQTHLNQSALKYAEHNGNRRGVVQSPLLPRNHLLCSCCCYLQHYTGCNSGTLIQTRMETNMEESENVSRTQNGYVVRMVINTCLLGYWIRQCIIDIIRDLNSLRHTTAQYQLSSQLWQQPSPCVRLQSKCAWCHQSKRSSR